MGTGALSAVSRVAPRGFEPSFHEVRGNLLRRASDLVETWVSGLAISSIIPNGNRSGGGDCYNCSRSGLGPLAGQDIRIADGDAVT